MGDVGREDRVGHAVDEQQLAAAPALLFPGLAGDGGGGELAGIEWRWSSWGKRCDVAVAAVAVAVVVVVCVVVVVAIVIGRVDTNYVHSHH